MLAALFASNAACNLVFGIEEPILRVDADAAGPASGGAGTGAGGGVTAGADARGSGGASLGAGGESGSGAVAGGSQDFDASAGANGSGSSAGGSGGMTADAAADTSGAAGTCTWDCGGNCNLSYKGCCSMAETTETCADLIGTTCKIPDERRVLWFLEPRICNSAPYACYTKACDCRCR
jgi:hypothetical protein